MSEDDTKKITMIRFGGFGKRGSETWVEGQNIRKDQLRELKALVAEHDGTAPQSDDFSDIV